MESKPNMGLVLLLTAVFPPKQRQLNECFSLNKEVAVKQKIISYTDKQTLTRYYIYVLHKSQILLARLSENNDDFPS